MQLCSTVLFVSNIGQSVQFYAEYFKQEVLTDFGPCVGFKSGLALWQMDHAARVTGVSADVPVVSNRGGMELEFQAVDIEGAYNRLKSAGIKMLHDLITQPWEQRAFRCMDPDGHLIEVGENLAATAQRLQAGGKSAEQIAQVFSMPIEVVQMFLGLKLEE